MELITLGIGLIVNTCVKNKALHTAVDDFVTESVNWFRGWFKEADQEPLIQKLEAEPESEEVKEELGIVMNEMLKNDQFKKELEKWVNESKKPYPAMKNVLEGVDIDVEGHINIGDKGGREQVHNKKNVVKDSKIKGRGDFNLGDMQ